MGSYPISTSLLRRDRLRVTVSDRDSYEHDDGADGQQSGPEERSGEKNAATLEEFRRKTLNRSELASGAPQEVDAQR